MASAVRYIANVGKSVKYAAIDVLKDMNPVITDTIETNQDVAKITYSSIKNFKSLSAKAYKSLSQSQVGELAKDLKKNLMEDIKNGTFYNKKRATTGMMEAAQNSDMFSGEDFEFEVVEDEDESETMKASRNTVDAVSNVMARTAEYQVEATRQSTNRILAQTAALNATLHSDLGILNANVSGLVKFNAESMTTHLQNSQMFYQRQQEQMDEQTAILRELLDLQKSVLTPKSRSMDSKVGVGDIFTANGAINLAEYFKLIKQNMQDADPTGLSSILSSAKGMGASSAIVSNPLGFVMTEAIKATFPKILKDSFSEFNETLSGSMATALINASKAKDSFNPIVSALGNIFGVDLKTKNSLDTSIYNKDAIPWSGKDHKALTEVIPTLLSKIYSSVSGTEETRYNYESGKFISMKKIKSSFESQKNRYVRRANDTVIPYLNDMISSIDFGNTKRQQEFLQNLESILKQNFKNMEYFNPNDRSKSAKSYGLKGSNAEYDLELIRRLYSQIPKNKQLRNQQDLLEAQRAINSWISELETQGDSVYNALFNNSKSKKTKTASPILGASDKLDTTNSLLYDIRTILSGGTPTPGNKYKVTDTGVTITATKPVDKNKNPKKVTNDIGLNIDTTSDKKFKYGENVESFDVGSTGPSPKSYLDRLRNAETASAKLAAFISGANDIAKQPIKFMSNILKKTDERMYTLLFGSDKDKKNSILGKITDGLDLWFEDLKDMTKQRFNDFKTWLFEKDVKQKARGLFNKLFGIDTEEWFKDFRKAAFGDENISIGKGIKNIFKEGFKDIWDGIKNTFSSTGAATPLTGEYTEEGRKKAENNKTINDLQKSLNKATIRIKKTKKADDGTGKVEETTTAAAGLKRVSKTGVIAVSEGEMIVPPDLNPYNIRKRRKNEQEAISKFENTYGKIKSIPSFAKGGTYNGDDNKDKNILDRIIKSIDDTISSGGDVEPLLKKLSGLSNDAKDYILSHLDDETVATLHGRFGEIKSKFTQKINRDDYVKGKENILYRMQDAAKDIFSNAKENQVVSNIVSKISESINKNQKTTSEGKEVVTDIMSNFGKYLPRIAAGGVTGLALSTLLGLAGGPLLGAAVGSGLGLLSNSKKLQRWLFGEKIVDDEGNESIKGGILGDDIKKNIHKYFPNMAKGAIVGGITSILPFVPGGPMAGILVGSAVGFAKSNDKLSKQLFGEDKALGKMKKTLEQKLPRMGLGAAAMFLGGPFGITTNLMVGAGLGFVSDTDKFKDIVFGTKGSNGVRTGGLVGYIKEATEIPIENIKKIYQTTLDWFNKDFLPPLKKAVSPIVRQFSNIGNWFKDAITGGIRDHITRPIGRRLMDSLIKPIERIGGGLVRGILAPGRWALGGISKGVGAIGGSLRRHQLRTVGGAAGDARSRVAEMEALDANRTNKRYTNTAAYKSASLIGSMSNEELVDMQAMTEYLQAGNTIWSKGKKKSVLNKYARSVVGRNDKMLSNDLKQLADVHSITAGDFDRIWRYIVAGDGNAAAKLLNDIPENPNGYFGPDEKKAIIKRVVAAAKTATEARKNAEKAHDKAKEILNTTGVDVTKSGFNRELKQEIAERGLDQDEVQEQQQKTVEETITDMNAMQKDNHTEIMSILERISDNLEVIAFPDSAEAIKAKRAKRNNTAQKEDEAEKKDIPLVTTLSDAQTIAEEGSTSDVQDIISGKTTGGRVKGILRRLANNIFRKKKQSKTVITENGPIKTRIDAQGNEIPDERDSETKETLAIGEEQRSTQRGILSKISGLGDTLKGLLGFGKEDEDNDEGIFSKILKGALKYALPVLGGLAGLGIARKAANTKIKVQQRDANGNKVYDENGNPVMEEMTIADAVKDGASRMWLGDDLTGNTSGAWYHIKDFTRNTVIPLIGDGLDLLTEKLPGIISTVVQHTVENAPQLFIAVGKGIGVGIWNVLKGFLQKIPGIGRLFGSSDKKDTKSSSSIEGGSSSKITVDLAGGKTTQSGTTGSSTGSTASTLQSMYDKRVSGSTNTTTSTTNTTSNTNTVQKSSSNGGLALVDVNSTPHTVEANIKDNSSSVKDSLAYKNASNSVQKKALEPLASIWNNSVLADGTTVAQLCNDDSLVIAEFTDSNGNVYQVTGATVLWYPDIASQIFGIDISLTDKERDENSELVRNATGNNAGDWALTKIIATGGKYGNAKTTAKVLSKGGKLAANIGSKVNSVLSKTKKIPVIGKALSRIGKVTNVLGKATQFSANAASIPVRAADAMKSGVQEFNALRKGGFTAKESLQWMAGNAQVSARKGLSGAKEALNATMDARQADRSAKLAEKSKGILGGIKGTIQKGKNAVMDTIDNAAQKIGNKAIDTASNATKIDSSDVSKATKGMKEALNKATQKGGKIGSALGAASEKAGKLSSSAKDVISKLTTLLGDFFSDSKVIGKLKDVLKCGKVKKEATETVLKEALEKFADKILQKFTKGIAKSAAKLVAKISTKLASYIGSGGIIAVAFLIADFISGMSKADAIMGVEKPTIAERFIAGLVNAFAETFFITLVVDTSTLVQTSVDFLEGLGLNFDDLRKRQEEAEANCDQYNREHGTNYTVEEYLMNDHLSTKIKRALGKVGSAVKGAGKAVVNVGKSVGSKAVDLGKSIGSKAVDLGKGAVSTVKKVGSSIFDKVTSLFKGKKSTEEAQRGTYIYDDQGNIVGLDSDNDGTADSMYIPQGDSEGKDIAGITTEFNTSGVSNTESTITDIDQTQPAISGTGSVISEKNQQLINQSYMDINNSIPNMIKQTKANLAGYFGVNPSDMDRTVGVGINTMKGNGPAQLFQKLKTMWSQATTKIGPFVNNLPKTLYSGMKDLSRFLAISMGFADPQDKDVDLNEIIKNKSYVDKRAQDVLESSPFAWLGGVSGTASVDSDIQEQSREQMAQGKKSTSETFTQRIANGAKGFVKAIGNFFGIGGSGSGLDDQAHVIEGNRADDESNFISQVNGAYARKVFKGPQDTERQTVADAGCAPAVATMAINSAGYSAVPITMDEAMKTASKFKLPNGGVTADYFIDEFRSHGLNSAFVSQSDPNKDKTIINQLNNGTPVILLGRDETNKSKSSSPFGPNDHYVVATGLSNDNRSVYINDPEATKPKIKYGLDKVLKHSILGIVPLVRKKNQREPNAAITKIKRILKTFSGRAYIGDMQGDYLGRISRPFESGNRGPTMVGKDKWANDGGCSCGTYQMTWRSGAARKFWTWSGYADKYGAATDPSTLMTLWKKAAEENPDAFFEKEHEYIYENFYIIATRDCKSQSNFDPDTHSRAMQECIWSWAIHRGAQSAADDFDKCIKNAGISDPQKADEKTLVKACYDYRYNTCQAKGWLPPGDKRYSTSEQSANSEYYMVTTELGGKAPIDPKSGSSNGAGTGQTGDTTQTSSEGTILDKILDAFNALGAAYGLTTSTTSGTTDTGDTGSSGGSNTSYVDTGDIKGNVSSNKEYAQKQVELVKKMKSVEGKLKYAQNNAKYPGSRNPDDGSGDCSSTIQWAYKNVLGVDPGDWTGAQRTDSDTYTVATSTADESKLQLGDILLKNGHVEMYYGDHKMIGHGGGVGGKTPGPTVKELGGTPPYDLVRRWVGFKDATGSSTFDGSVAGSGSGMFVSQNDSRYANKSIGTRTVADAGCAPAVATMAVSSILGGSKYNMNTAIRDASKYQNNTGDVTADYFADEFARNGIQASYISGSNTNALKSAISKGNVVLLGKDASNTTKAKSPFGPSGHYILATGMSNDGKSIYVNDPEAKRGNKKYPSDILKHTVLGVNASGGSSKISDKIKNKLKSFFGKATYTYVFAGDSRTVGIEQAVGKKHSDTKFIAKTSMGYSWLKSTAESQISSAVKDNPSAKIVLLFGVNDLNNINNYIKEYESLEQQYKGKNTIYYVSVNPVHGGTSVTNEQIEQFNAKLKEFAGSRYIDTYSMLKRDGFNSSDGLHYNSSTNEKIYNFIINAINGSVTTSNSTTDMSNIDQTSNTEESSSPLSQILDAFNELAVGYGLKAKTTTTSTSNEGDSTGSSSSSTETGSYSGFNGQEQVWSYLKNKGIPDEGIAGLMGNIEHESGFQFNNVENLLEKRLKEKGKPYYTDDLYTKAVDNNTISRAEFLNPLPGKQYGYGLVQWTSPGRKAGLYDLVKSRNKSIADPGSQMDWLWEELNNSYPGVLNTMKTSKDIRTVSTKVLKDFESPADTGSSMQNKRYNSAQTIYNTYHGKDIGGSGSGLSDTPLYDYKSDTTSTTPITIPETKSSSRADNIDKLVEVVIKLLAKVVDNTTSIKDIASLLIKLVDASGANTTSSPIAEKAVSGSMVASQLALQALRESTRTTEDEEIVKLIRSVESIAMQ